jgi:hypothetical protein
MENDPAVEFTFYLAQKLGKTVAEIRDGMGHQEFVEWGIYYARKAQRAELDAGKGTT